MTNEDIIREIDNLYADNLRDKINGTELYEKLTPLIQQFRGECQKEAIETYEAHAKSLKDKYGYTAEQLMQIVIKGTVSELQTPSHINPKTP